MRIRTRAVLSVAAVAACAGLAACAPLISGTEDADTALTSEGISLKSSDFGSWNTQQAGGISLVTPGQSLPKSNTPSHLQGTLDTNPSGCVSVEKSDGTKVLLLAPFGSTLGRDGSITIHGTAWSNGDSIDVQGSEAPVDEITLPEACHDPSTAFFADKVQAAK